MDVDFEPNWPEHVLLTRHALTPNERMSLARLAAAGQLERIAPGAYMQATVWVSHSTDERYRDVIRARDLTSRVPFVVSHSSAGALWLLPRIGPWTTPVHVLANPAKGGRSIPGVTRHTVGVPDVLDRIDGIWVTTLVRTVVDIARTGSLQNAVVAADAALASRHLAHDIVTVSRRDLMTELQAGAARGRARARAALDFADGASGSPGESLSRIAIARERLSAPILQQRFDDGQGAMFTDFFWPNFGVIGEFDGVGKYLRSEWTGGRNAAQVVIDEKWREDRLRLLGFRMVRWGWELARHPVALGRLLRSVGVR